MTVKAVMKNLKIVEVTVDRVSILKLFKKCNIAEVKVTVKKTLILYVTPLKIDLVSHPSRVKGLTNMLVYILSSTDRLVLCIKTLQCS